MTFFRSGGGAAARAYLEQNHARADDYYLAEGAGLADRAVLDSAGQIIARDALSGDGYEAWADWRDPVSGEVRGVPRERTVKDPVSGDVLSTATSPRFAEMTVNADKTLSIAAAVDPEVSAALDEAMRAAADEMSAYLAKNSKTRVGPLGAQRLVAVERFEAATIMHQTSRAGDPHRHAHVQFSTRVFAGGKWRALDTATTLRQQGALRGLGEAVINSHPELRQALARAGFTFDPATGKVLELEPFSEGMSKRAAQVASNRDRIEAEWRAEHPGRAPGPAVQRAWDRQAWNLDRPEKKPTELSTTERWVGELVEVGYIAPVGPVAERAVAIASLDRDRIAAVVVEELAVMRSAWSVADLHDKVGHRLAQVGLVVERGVLGELVEDITDRAAKQCLSLADPSQGIMPDSLRHLTSEHVLATDNEVRTRLARLGAAPGGDAVLGELVVAGRTRGVQQHAAVCAIAGTHRLVVIEGAAGAGKTTALKAAKQQVEAQGRTQILVAPTLKAAQEAGRATGADASSLHRLLLEHGWRWTDTGRWYRLSIGDADPETGAIYEGPRRGYDVDARTQIVVDEAGMVNQDAGAALLQVVDETGASLVALGDRAQKAAVGRGGWLDAAVRHSASHVDVTQLHRFVDPEFAKLTLQMRERRDPGAVFDALVKMGLVRVHASEDDARAAIAADTADAIAVGRTVANTVATNAEASSINDATRRHLVEAGIVSDDRTVAGADGVALGRGDRIMTRQNDSQLGVANRETFTVLHVYQDGRLTVAGEDRRRRTLPAEYVKAHAHLAYAATDFGNQGGTAARSNTLANERLAADGGYVGTSRGREQNLVHFAAVDEADAREQWVELMTRDTADRGIEAARRQLAEQTRNLDLTTETRTVARLVAEHQARQQGAKRVEEATTPAGAGAVPEALLQRVSPAMRERLQETRRILDTLNQQGQAAKRATTAERVENEWERRLGRVQQLEKQIDLYERVLQRSAAVEAWDAAGKPRPRELEAAARTAHEDVKRAQRQLEVTEGVAAKAAELAASTARQTAQSAMYSVSAAQHTANTASLFKRRAAEAALQDARAAAEQRAGRPLPERLTAPDQQAWVREVADAARQTAERTHEPRVEAARQDVQRATRQEEEAQEAAAVAGADWTAHVAHGVPEQDRAWGFGQSPPITAYDDARRAVVAAQDLPKLREQFNAAYDRAQMFDTSSPERQAELAREGQARRAQRETRRRLEQGQPDQPRSPYYGPTHQPGRSRGIGL